MAKDQPRRNFNTKIALLADKRKERLTRVAALYVQGRFTMKEMAQRCGEVTVRQIERDIQHLRKVWAEAASEDVKFYLSKELYRIDRIEAECWRGWEASWRAETETGKQTEEDAEGNQVVKKVRKKKYGNAGNPAFMSQILGCVDRRMRLLGLEDRSQGGADDIQVHAVEVICENREQAMAMIEFEDFRTIVKR
jgi:hypothetical protein